MVTTELNDAQRRIQEFSSGDLPLEDLARVEDLVDFKNSTRIGSGSLGDVLQVVDLASQQPLAIKVISRSKVNARGVGEDRLQREVQVMSELKHPNVVRIVDVLSGLQELPNVNSDSEPPYLCIVMELIDASWPLSYEIRRSGAQPDLVTKVLPQLASGLNEIHSKSIVHRDVWSENVLINKDGHIVLVDLGCAESIAGPTVCRNLNIPYLSPQAARCEKQHPSDDAWAAGLLVSEIATGLFLLQRLGRTDIPIHKVPSALSAAIMETQAVAGSLIGGLVMQLLNLEHERRPTMQEVLLRLEAAPMDVSDLGPSRSPRVPVQRLQAARKTSTPMRSVPRGSPPPCLRGGETTPMAKIITAASPSSDGRFACVQPGFVRSPSSTRVATSIAVPSSARAASVVRQTSHRDPVASESESLNSSWIPQDDRPGTPVSSRLNRPQSYTSMPSMTVRATPAGPAMTPLRIRATPGPSRHSEANDGTGLYSRPNSVVRASPSFPDGAATPLVSPPPYTAFQASPQSTRIADPSGTLLIRQESRTRFVPQESARASHRMAHSSSRQGRLSREVPTSDAAWAVTPQQANGMIFLQARPAAVTRQASGPKQVPVPVPVMRQSSTASFPSAAAPPGVVVAVASEESKVETTASMRHSLRLRPPGQDGHSRPSLRQALAMEAQRTRPTDRGVSPDRRPPSVIKSARPSTSIASGSYSANLVDKAFAFSANMRAEASDILKGIEKLAQTVRKDASPLKSRSTLPR